MVVRQARHSKKDEEFMRLALKLAEKGRGKTSPNPMVGAVVVKRGRILAKGYHRKFGGPHAEAVAIMACAEEARGATLYITLEPCCYFGKTPPCTDLIVESGIKRVVCATVDPNPRVNGKGVRALRRKGIRVNVGAMREEARRLNEVCFKHMTTGLPFVLLSAAQSLDGRVIPRHRSSGIKLGRVFSALVRSKKPLVDAILFDASATSADSMATFLESADSARIKLILLGSWHQIDRTLEGLGKSTVERIIVVPADSKTKRIGSLNGFEQWQVRRDKSGEISLLSLLRKARKRGITSLLVESGTSLATSLVKRKLVDKVWYFISPEVLTRGKEPFGDLKIRKISDAVTLENCEYRQSKDGLVVVGYPIRASS